MFARCIARSVCFGLVLTVCGSGNPGQAGTWILGGKQQDGFRLPEDDKTEIAVAQDMLSRFGDSIWPGFAKSKLPIVLYDDKTAFLIGEQKPPPPWRPVTGDTVLGEPYFWRQASKERAFAVPINGRQAGSIATFAYMNSKAPFKMARDLHVCLLLHEMFHAFQATVAPRRFKQSNAVYKLESKYPYKDADFAKSWNAEGEALWRGARAADLATALAAARDFLRLRAERRRVSNLSPELIGYERDLEWLEGMAKYTELRFLDLGSRIRKPDEPIPFKAGKTYEVWDLARLRSTLGSQAGDLRFYLSGMAQARMLDILDPAWKKDLDAVDRSLEKRLSRVVDIGTLRPAEHAFLLTPTR
ncbi:MAG: hypothetical protein ACHQ50_00700 [Fimbriimonadales bacterium]